MHILQNKVVEPKSYWLVKREKSLNEGNKKNERKKEKINVIGIGQPLQNFAVSVAQSSPHIQKIPKQTRDAFILYQNSLIVFFFFFFFFWNSNEDHHN